MMKKNSEKIEIAGKFFNLHLQKRTGSNMPNCEILKILFPNIGNKARMPALTTFIL